MIQQLQQASFIERHNQQLNQNIIDKYPAYIKHNRFLINIQYAFETTDYSTGIQISS